MPSSLKRFSRDYFLIFALLCLSTGTLFAQEVTEINSERFSLSINTPEKRLFFEDTSGELLIEEVWSSDSLFQAGDSGPRSRGSMYWVKVKLLNNTPYDLEVVATGPRTVNSTLYKREGEHFFSSTFGSFVPKKELKQGDSRTHVALRLKAGVAEDIYFRVNGRSFTASFTDARTYHETKAQSRLQDYFFFGACLILILYTLIQYAVYKKRMFLYLGIFALGYAMYAFSVRGYFVDWFLPNYPEDGLNFTFLWSQLGQLGVFLLTINFLQLKSKFPKWYKVFQVLIIFLVLRTGYGLYLTAVLVDYGAMTNMGLLTMFIDIIIFKAFFFALWKKVNTSGKVFLSGLVLFGFVLILGIIVWRFNVISDFRLALLYIASFASLSQVIIFSIALGIQLRQYEVDKNVALDKLNATLKDQNKKIEQEVIDRTAEINQQKSQLEERNDRIETLFKEVHHRVKNNLQLISSLLNMQQEWSSTEDPAKAIEDSRSRVVAMSMIHQFLYRTDDISTIDFKQYAEELAHRLDEIQVEKVNFSLKIHFDQAYTFDIDTSISLGLILNELITNSYKHSLINRRSLDIGLRLEKDKPGYFKMVYSDNGDAIKEPFTEVVKRGFGLRLASRLSRQLQGTFGYNFEEGNHFTVSFASEAQRIAMADAD